jgi:aminoglycoside phosphotransferase (APT) family kinase protein
VVDKNSINPNEHHSVLERYLSAALEYPVQLVRAEPLTESSRQAPWRLDVAGQDGELRKYVLRLDTRFAEHEYAVLQEMESLPIPTPRVYGWDPEGQTLGVPCFFSDFIEGQSLLEATLAGERWAEDLFIDTVCALQEISREQLAGIADHLMEEQTAENFLEGAYDYFKKDLDPLAEAVYAMLKASAPEFPKSRFSNGDLWLDNMIVQDQKLVAVIDFQHAGFSDPIYEFLLPFFVAPGLRGRAIEARYCRRMGYDPDVLPWYRALEYFDTWHWVRSTGKAFVHHTNETLQESLEDWIQRS